MLEGMFNSWKVKMYAVCMNQIENLHSIQEDNNWP